jgi:hypothetical protein
MSSEEREQFESTIHDIILEIGGPEDAELESTLIAVLSLNNTNLSIAALAAISNLHGEGARAIPAILKAGLSGHEDLLINASCALGSIRDRRSVLALVELCKESDNYRALVEHTLPAFVKHDEECLPFISRVEDALCKKAPAGASAHIEILNALRSKLRDDRARDYRKVDFPGQVTLDPIIEAADLPIEELDDLETAPLPAEGNPVVDERFPFTVLSTKSSVGLEIHRLVVNDSPRHLVLFVEDEYGYGVEIPEIVDCLASVVGARYGLDPLSTYWATLTTRESGLALEGRDKFRLCLLENVSSTGRYSLGREYEFESMRQMIEFLNASYVR